MIKKDKNNNIHWCQKTLIIIGVVLFVLPLNLAVVFATRAKAKTPTDEIESFIDPNPDDKTGAILDDYENYATGYDGSGPAPILPKDDEPAEITSLKTTFAENTVFSTNETDTISINWLAENITENPKLIFNPADRQDIRMLSCLGNVIPDFANNDDSLAKYTDRTIAQIAEIKESQPDEYKNLITQAQEKARVGIVENLRSDLTNFACIAGVSTTQAAEMLSNDKESVDAIIDYAKNKVVIDRRILELLVNLVTPKNQGGAGHERIRVYRIRNGYSREAKAFSRESNAIRQQISDQNNPKVSTIADVATADRGTLDQNFEFASSDVQAEVFDAAGRSQGDLIFSDSEDDVNISAHAKGEAIDISEVDSMKCTLIKKKRIGSDKKIPQPPTPIKLAWQTTKGYDRSPPADYSSL